MAFVHERRPFYSVLVFVSLMQMWDKPATAPADSCRHPREGHTCPVMLTVVPGNSLLSDGGDVSYCCGAVRAYQNVTVLEKWQKTFQGYEHRQEL